MKYERAEEIVASTETFEVLYNGIPVWIEHLNPVNRTAHITSDNLPGKEKDVPVADLVEGPAVP